MLGWLVLPLRRPVTSMFLFPQWRGTRGGFCGMAVVWPIWVWPSLQILETCQYDARQLIDLINLAGHLYGFWLGIWQFRRTRRAAVTLKWFYLRRQSRTTRRQLLVHHYQFRNLKRSNWGMTRWGSRTGSISLWGLSVCWWSQVITYPYWPKTSQPGAKQDTQRGRTCMHSHQKH